MRPFVDVMMLSGLTVKKQDCMHPLWVGHCPPGLWALNMSVHAGMAESDVTGSNSLRCPCFPSQDGQTHRLRAMFDS